jgi:hypothetical protein
MPPKTKEKLTDSEKKKIKQANKAKANPKKSEAKAEKNKERRYTRGQDQRPEDIAAQEETKRLEKERAAAKKSRDDAKTAKAVEQVKKPEELKEVLPLGEVKQSEEEVVS